MSRQPDDRTPGEPPEIADAAFLFDDDPAPKGSTAEGPAAPAPAADAYEVADLDPELAAPTRPEPSQPPPRPERRKARPEADEPDPDRPTRAAEPPGGVSQLWSRGAEWGPTFGVLALVGLATLAVAYLSVQAESYGLAALLVLGGLALMLVLSYPIAVTLERPVRLTPEQALKDYFEALSHRWPHHRRMWLLLSDRGRESGRFDSFDGFRKYWRERSAAVLARAGAGAKGPVEYEVTEFKSEEKSAGKSAIEGTATVHARPRGASAEQVRYKVRFVRGGDRMWYIEDAALPDPREPRRRPAGPEVVDDEG